MCGMMIGADVHIQSLNWPFEALNSFFIAISITKSVMET